MRGLLRVDATVGVPAEQLWERLVDWPSQGEWVPLTRVRTVAGPGPAHGRPLLDTDVKLCEAILALSGTTNGRLAAQGFERLAELCGAAAGFGTLAEYLARRFDRRGEPLDDLVQVASVGLLNAIDRFDLDRDVQFSTYAAVTIIGELKRHFRDKGWAIRVPRRLQEVGLRVNAILPELSQELGRSPTLPVNLTW